MNDRGVPCILRWSIVKFAIQYCQVIGTFTVACLFVSSYAMPVTLWYVGVPRAEEGDKRQECIHKRAYGVCMLVCADVC